MPIIGRPIIGQCLIGASLILTSPNFDLYNTVSCITQYRPAATWLLQCILLKLETELTKQAIAVAVYPVGLHFAVLLQPTGYVIVNDHRPNSNPLRNATLSVAILLHEWPCHHAAECSVPLSI